MNTQNNNGAFGMIRKRESDVLLARKLLIYEQRNKTNFTGMKAEKDKGDEEESQNIACKGAGALWHKLLAHVSPSAVSYMIRSDKYGMSLMDK